MKFAGLFVAVFAILGLSTAQTFNKQYVGVAYSPYVKNFEGTATPYWNSYTLDDLKQQLRIVSSKFTSISTYSMGINQWNVNSPWDQADANCLVARAAAQLNQGHASPLITVNLGVIQNSDPAQQAAEIKNVYSAANEANALYPGTVTGVTFTNEYFVNTAQGEQILAMINEGKKNGLRVGTRIHTCGVIWDNNSELRPLLVKIIEAADFIYCNIYPGSDSVHSVDAAVNAVTNAYYGFRYAFQLIKSNIEVSIGETGWPDAGVSFNSSPNNLENLVNYWNQMAKWASDNKVKTQFFEAFDEPWKSDINKKDPNAPDGYNGGEGHYGWWKLPSNNKPYVYIEKATGAQVS